MQMRQGSRWRRPRRVAGFMLVGLLVIVGFAAGWIWWQLRRSLPQTDGAVVVAGLGAPVSVERDAHGVPTIRGASRIDVARALGFVHAQERFFQMDLARRRAAGELAELFGARALPIDTTTRVHRFRMRAQRVLAAADARERHLTEAYADGVNQGLAALHSPPFEYLVLRTTPAPWRPEDTALVLASMFINLQDEEAENELRALVLHDVLPAPLAEFLDSTISDWDTPILGDPLTPLPAPDASVFDLRQGPASRAAEHRAPARWPEATTALAADLGLLEGGEHVLGSNNWVVGGPATADGRAIVANDMHLAISVPNIWFRASLEWADERRPWRVTGVTLPGVPSVVAGSNGNIAWGFTNTTADWSDLVVVEPDPSNPARYLTPDGPQPFEIARERIVVKGEADSVVEVKETKWGPLRSADRRGRLLAIAWVPHFTEGMNLLASRIESAESLAQAFAVGHEAGLPAQNLVVADASGSIGWTIAGKIPRRVGFDGRRPVSWADGSRGWQGWYAPGDYPSLENPADGRIVTANNRLVGGAELAMLGDGGYDPGARARQIRDGLRAVPKATVADMLRVQLDDRAMLMERWRRVALEVLTADAVANHPGRREFRRLVLDTWTGRATIDSVGYRLVRQFRLFVTELTLEPFAVRVREAEPTVVLGQTRGIEGPVWTLITTRPPHLLDPRYADWPALLLAAVDKTVERLTEGGARLEGRTWGEFNTTRIEHPLGRAIPGVGRWLNMPSFALPGDSHVPRVQGVAFGASERFAVSPGLEGGGYFHMPGGQSGHPLSPYYRDGYEAWVRGEATPFLPGPAVSRLDLRNP